MKIKKLKESLGNDLPLKNEFKEFLEEMINNFDYSNVDGFFEEHGIENKEEVKKYLSLLKNIKIQF